MVRQAYAEDLEAAVLLAGRLWPEARELPGELSELLSREDGAVFLKFVGETPVGFAQCQLRRDYVEGTSSSPVGYLEGIFVDEEYRRSGYAGELLRACESWARARGCREFASDCELDNETSIRFHSALGFAEANRIVCFTKEL